MRKLTSAVAALAAAMALAGTAHADDTANRFEGKWEIKLMATAVLPSGSISGYKTDMLGLNGTGTQTAADNNVVPTAAIEYYLMPSVSLETICCVTAHHVSATAGPLAGQELVSNVEIVPATVTVKYHFTGLPLVRPYVGVGPSVFIMAADRPSAFLRSQGVARTMLSSEFGGAVQAGFDLPIGHGYAFSVDAKKYFMKTTAHLDTATADVEDISLNLNPWVVSAGVAYRF